MSLFAEFVAFLAGALFGSGTKALFPHTRVSLLAVASLLLGAAWTLTAGEIHLPLAPMAIAVDAAGAAAGSLGAVTIFRSVGAEKEK